MRTFACLLLLAGLTPAQIQGVFTVDPAKPPSSLNFQTLGDAVQAARRISGNVVFQVKPGTYRETLMLLQVQGASEKATVTFEGDGGTVVLSASIGDPRYCLDFRSGAKWFRFRDFKLTNYLDSGLIMDQATDNVFERCEIDDGFGVWPTIQAVKEHGASERNQFLRCVFRGTGRYLCLMGAGKDLFDGCEFDGLGKSSYLLSGWRGVAQNCFFHDNLAGSTPVIMYRECIFVHNVAVTRGSGPALSVTGASNDWVYAPIVKNNVLVNFGDGPTVIYQVDGSKLQLYPAVTDYNCHLAPNSRRMIIAGTPGYAYFAGNLHDFRLWQKASPTRIYPGGASAYEEKSFSVDPKLVSLVNPYDIHLTKESPLIDQGTVDIAPSYTQYGTVRVLNDFEGDLRTGAADIGADEISYGITGTGSGAIGTVMQLNLSAQFDGGLRYQVGTALGAGPIFIGSRILRLNFDALLVASMSGALPTIFRNYGGVLDRNGKATAHMVILDLPVLKGIELYNAFVTVRIGAPENIQTISNTFSFKIQ